MKKSIIVLIGLMLTHVASWACEVCKKQQPKILRGITHGAGPESEWDYVIIGIMVVIVLTSFFYTTKWIICPGEKELNHIKYSIFNNTAQ